MRLPLRWFLAALPLAAAVAAPGCNQLSGIDDYEKTPLQGTASCAVNADCAGLGEGYICRRADTTSSCVQLLSEDCQTINGDYANDDAFIFVSILPTLQADGVTPGPGAPLLNAMRLAVADFTGTAAGLPPLAEGRARRPLVMLECNDQGDLVTANRAAQHAVREVGLPAVLGPMFSGLTLRVATDVTIPNGAFLLSPTAATQSLTELKDFGLVWRAAPSADLQVQVLANFFSVIEQDPVARASFGLSSDALMKVASVYKDDAFGNGLAGGLRGSLTFNKNPATSQPNNDYFFEYNYGNPDNPTSMLPRFQEVADDIIAKQPHVVLLLGVEEITRDLLPLIESGWTGARRPFYLSASGPYTPSLFEYVKTNDATTGIRRRIVGVVPGSNNNVFAAFRSKYGSIYEISEADTSGPANAYDAVYMLAYSVVGLGEAPITGASIAQAMKRLVPPAQVTVSAGPLEINTAYDELSSLRNINFEGASGPLDFNVESGDPNSEMQIWCVGANNSGKYSGAFYDTKNVLTGSMVEVRENCGFLP
ncbi:MAG: ABC transporter substrate-binding protein [Polyangiaceae bacterium]|nr:ABC transporter substrate-binding protein [Polyangiaceae bacterium]